MRNIKFQLTEDEAFYLRSEMDMLLRSYKRVYAGRCFDNEAMANAFNKVYKAIADKDHSDYLRVNMSR